MTRYRLRDEPGVAVELLNLGLACCSLEVEAAVGSGALASEVGTDPTPDSTVLLVSGTVTHALAPAVIRAWERASEQGPVRVLAFGACATSGGPYWDAPSVVPGVDALIPVSRYVPGCPPGPDSLIAALRREVA
ncbi:MAG: NADH-quinone oxidoreductase subunit B [Actinomycetota bacterium]